MFHFYTLLCDVASIPRKAPSAWMTADRLVASDRRGGKDEETAVVARVQSGSRHAPPGRLGSGQGHLVSLDARALAQESLKEVGRELGVPR